MIGIFKRTALALEGEQGEIILIKVDPSIADSSLHIFRWTTNNSAELLRAEGSELTHSYGKRWSAPVVWREEACELLHPTVGKGKIILKYKRG